MGVPSRADGSSKEALKRAKQRKRRKKHPGVVLMRPEPARAIGWRARYRDPDSKRMVKVSLPADRTNEAQREAWAVNKSRELAKRRAELDAGAPRATGKPLSEAFDHYFQAHPHLGERTRADYRAAANKLLAWAKREGFALADDLNRARLMHFRESLIREPKHATVKGEGVGRGRRRPTAERRSPERINTELRKAGTVLAYLIKLDMLPRLTRDELRQAIEKLPVASERIEFLRPNECQALLEACLKHDAKTWAETREEHRKLRPKGTTRRYDAIAPFAAFVLLSGCRFGEALRLDWGQVDLEALDHEGRKAGEIYIRGAAAKTRKARTIGLDVSPALRDLLIAMRPEEAKGSVFAFSRAAADAAAKRLRADYGAPATFGWQALRRTCGTFLTNAPGIFGAASAYRSARQLGHSVQVAERHYLGLVRGIPPTARTLEAAMQIEEVLGKVLGAVGEHVRLSACLTNACSSGSPDEDTLGRRTAAATTARARIRGWQPFGASCDPDLGDLRRGRSQ